MAFSPAALTFDTPPRAAAQPAVAVTLAWLMLLHSETANTARRKRAAESRSEAACLRCRWMGWSVDQTCLTPRDAKSVILYSYTSAKAKDFSTRLSCVTPEKGIPAIIGFFPQLTAPQTPPHLATILKTRLRWKLPQEMSARECIFPKPPLPFVP